MSPTDTLDWFDAHAHSGRTPAAGLPPQGVRVLNAMEPADADKLIALADRDPRFIPCVGLHPWKVDERSLDEGEAIPDLLRRHPRLHIGETGLDRSDRGGPWHRQLQWLERLLAWSAEFGRVVSLHNVRAEDALEDVVTGAPDGVRGYVLHGWRGPPDRMRWWLEHGAYFSWNAELSNTRSGRAGFKEVPEDRLLVETDDGPADELWSALHGLASLRGMEVAEVAALTHANGRRLWSVSE